jgi:hypothetical protein
LGRILRFNDPLVGLLLAPEAMEVVIKVSELVRQDVAVWDDVKRFFSKLFLHLNNVGNQLCLMGEFEAVGEMINSLVFVQ